MAIKNYSTTASNNVSVNGSSISEGMAPSAVNNSMREIVKDIREGFNEKEWFILGDGDGTTTFSYASSTSVTVASDITSSHHVGRRVKVVGSNTGTIYGKIATSSYSSPNTTITFTFDSGSISSSDTTVDVYVGSTFTNPANPVVDEDNMASDSAILPPSQQSTKAFVESGTSTLTNKTIDSANNTLTVDLSEATVTGTLAEFNTAVSDATLVSTTGTETLTNKTLTSPTVSGLALSDASMVFEGSTDDAFETTLAVADPTADRTVTLPNATTNLVGEDTTNTLTNKSISGSSNTLSNIGNSSLVNSSINYGGVSLSLGGSDTTPAFDLTDATNYPTSSLTGTITNAQLAGSIAGTKLLDDAVTTAKIIDDAVTTVKIIDNAVTIDKIADSVIVTNSEHSAHTPDDSSFLTTSASDARYFRQDSTETISSGDTWSASDSYIATTSAIDNRVIDLVDDVGGFVPIANETSFPSANPDVNNGAGTIVSVSSIGTTRTPTAGTVTIANGSGSNTVTITGCGSTVLTAGYGVLVETTTTLHTYTFHRLVPKATEVTTVASISSDITTVANNNSNITAVAGNATNINTVGSISSNVTTVAGISSNVTTVAGDTSNISTVAGATTNINNVGNSITNVNTVAGSISNVNTVATNISDVNNFADTYFISASAPSSPTLGDLWFDTSSDTMKVYTSGGFANAGSSVNGTSERFKYTATASQTTFSGADASGNTLAYDAGFLDVYLNGIKLINGTDFTATNGTSIVLTSGATVNDTLDVVTFGTFQLSNFSINDANDVSTAGVTNGQVLAYNSTSSAFQPSTIDLTNLSASNLTSGTIPDARFPATLPAISGANLTNLDASDLASGTIPDARFPATLPVLNGSALTNLTSGNLTGALPAIDGSALTGISAGSIPLTAGADITLGDTLEITASGTVKPVLADGTLVSNELRVLNGAVQNQIQIVVLETDKYFAVYSEDSSSVIKGVFITNSNGVLSLGTPVTVKSTANTNGYAMRLRKLSSSLCILVDRTSDYSLQATAISISGSTITSGTTVSLFTGSNNNSFDVGRLDDTRFYVQRNYHAGHVPQPSIGRVGSISGTTITLGSELSTSFSTAYADSNLAVVPISSSKVMLIWSRYSTYKPNCWFANISGTTITSYSGVTELGQYSYTAPMGSAILDSSNVVVAMSPNIDNMYFMLFDTTGSTPSLTQTVVYASDRSSEFRFGMGLSSTGVTFGFRNQSSTSNGNLTMSSLTYDASVPSLTKNEVVTISSEAFLGYADADVLNGTGIIIAQDNTNNDLGAFLFNPTLNDSVKRFIGVAGETFTNGNTGSVVHVGGVVSGLTGLTVGKNYYISLSNGSLSTTVSNVEVGKAISTTQLLITKTGVLN